MAGKLNPYCLLICGEASTGKTASLEYLKNQDKWLYLGCEAGKELSFKSNFQQFAIDNPLEVFKYFDAAINEPKVEGIVIDSLTFLMQMFESQYVINAQDTRAAWVNYGEFFKTLMQDKIIKFQRPTIIIAHTLDTRDELTFKIKTSVPIKGALKGFGVESFFNTVISTKVVPITTLDKYNNDYLTITEDERFEGVKHVFQTRLTADTSGEKIRSPKGLFSIKEAFIDNNIQFVLDKLHNYYN